MFDARHAMAVLAIVGAFTYAIVSALARARVRELEIRERIAMIEKGMIPPPEVDPAGFERRLHRMRHLRQAGGFAASRHRRAGITLMAVGFGLMVLLALAADTVRVGVGVGGFLVVLGVGFCLNSFFELQHELPHEPPSSSAEPPPPLAPD